MDHLVLLYPYISCQEFCFCSIHGKNTIEFSGLGLGRWSRKIYGQWRAKLLNFYYPLTLPSRYIYLALRLLRDKLLIHCSASNLYSNMRIVTVKVQVAGVLHIVDSAFLWKSKENRFLLYVYQKILFLGINKFSATNYSSLQYYYVKK